MIIINCVDSLRLRGPIVEVISSVTSKNTVVLTLACQSAKFFAQSSAEILACGYAKNISHPNNSLINIQTPYLAFRHSLGSPIISGWLPNPLIFNQTAYLQSGDYLSRRNSSMQNPISHYQTLSVNDIYSQNLYTSSRVAQTFRVSFSDAVNLRLTVSQVQKEKDSTANATLWDHAYLRHEINQSVNLPSFRGSVNQVNNFDEVNHRTYCLLVGYCSIPRDCNSLRIILFIHADTEASPSWANAALIPCSRDGSTLNAICLFPFPAILMVDTWFTPVYIGFIHQVYDKCRPKTTTPRSAANTIEASNHNVKEAYAMDTPQHNQTRLKFTFLIASGTQRLVDIHPVRLITVLADSEGEARLLAGIPSLIFVSRQPRNIGIDTPFNRSDMSTVQGVNHV